MTDPIIGAPKPLSPEEISLAYRTALRREADIEALKKLSVSKLSVHDLYRRLLTSPEFRELCRKDFAQRIIAHPALPRTSKGNRKKILCFGAYGNGNLGDAIQPRHVADIIRDLIGPKVEFFASSWINNKSYEGEGFTVISETAIFDPYLLSQMDFVVFGGGGLLGPYHYPLVDGEWVNQFRKLNVPYGLLGIGVATSAMQEKPIVGPFKHLVSGARFATARSAAGVEQLQLAGGTGPICQFPDPVLLNLALNETISQKGQPGCGNGKDTNPAKNRTKGLLIIKRPNSPEQRRFMEIASRLDAENNIDVEFCVIEPHLEDHYASTFRKPFHIVTDEKGFTDVVNKVDYVISSRYHGCILSFVNSIPVFGIGEDKIRQSLDMVGMSKNFIRSDQVESIVMQIESSSLKEFSSKPNFKNVLKSYTQVKEDIRIALSSAF
jgi:hypothetical protein